MKILVIDDTRTHLTAALQTFTGHDVTVCASHDEALKFLSKQYDEPERQRLLEKYRAEGFENSWSKACNETLLPYWDAVLCDLLMPAGRDAQGGDGMKFIGQEMPVGWSLALTAAKCGAKYVAVVTDMNHHHHPASAMLDRLDGHIFTIDDAKMLLTNHVGMVGIAGTEHTCPDCGGTGKKKWENGGEYDCYSCKAGTAFAEKGKNWGAILGQLLGEKSDDE